MVHAQVVVVDPYDFVHIFRLKDIEMKYFTILKYMQMHLYNIYMR